MIENEWRKFRKPAIVRNSLRVAERDPARGRHRGVAQTQTSYFRLIFCCYGRNSQRNTDAL